MDRECIALPDGTILWIRVDEGERGILAPSSGEYPLYDGALYSLLSIDQRRVVPYVAAIAQAVAGRTVVDIGTGRDANWALCALKHGARKVYAIEELPETVKGARATLAAAGAGDRIQLIQGSSLGITLPERVDVCVSEIIGAIGGAEGALPVLDDARARFLQPGGVMIPWRVTTMMAAVGLQQWLGAPPAVILGPAGTPRLQRIFNALGGAFDVRLGLCDPPDVLLSEQGVFEDIVFADVDHPAAQSSRLPITRAGQMDGLLLYIKLYCDPLAPPIDSFHQLTSWSPIFIPLFDEPQQVQVGDELSLHVERRLSSDGVHPDYVISAVLVRGGRAAASCQFLSSHHGPAYRQNRFYRDLFQVGTEVG